PAVLFPQIVRRVFSLGDIGGDTCDANNPAGLVEDWKDSLLDPAHRTVRTDDPVFVIGLPSRHSCLVLGVGRCSVLGMDRLRPRLRVRIRAFAAPAPDLCIGWADVYNAIAVGVDEEEYIAD